MATLYLDANGVVKTASVGLIPGGTEPPHAATFEYDETTNPVLHTRAINNVPGDLVVKNGQVFWKGAVVTVAPDSALAIQKKQTAQDKQQIDQALGQLDTLIDASNAGNLNATQQQQAMKILLRVARYVLRWIAQRG